MDSSTSSSSSLAPTATISSRILLDVPCRVCQDTLLENTMEFFHAMAVLDSSNGLCGAIASMNKEAVQHERGPRNSTLKRQMAMLNGLQHHRQHHPKPTIDTPRRVSTQLFSPNLPISQAPTNHAPNNSIFCSMDTSGNLQLKSSGASMPSCSSSFPFGSLPFNTGNSVAAASDLFNSLPGFMKRKQEDETSWWFYFDLVHNKAKIAGKYHLKQYHPALYSKKLEAQPKHQCPQPSRAHQPAERGGLNVESTIVRLLSWARSLLAFVPGLSVEEQICIVSSSMSRLFLVTAIQDHLLSSVSLSGDIAASSSSSATFSSNMRKRLVKLVAQIEGIQFDATEFNLLRILLLLKEKMPQIQQLLQLNLAHHQQICFPFQPLRYIQTMVIVDSLFSLETNSLLGLLGNNRATNGVAKTEAEQKPAVHLPTKKSADDSGVPGDAKLDCKISSKLTPHPFSVSALTQLDGPATVIAQTNGSPSSNANGNSSLSNSVDSISPLAKWDTSE
uniref:NR LBD domain-containing protein n=1 Tax=Ditylenchus dipsaci TaxID=166011 RepID=A0A915DHW7_9BILA